MEVVRGSTGPAERPLLPLVSESSGSASRESQAFEVSWIPGGLWRQKWTHCAACCPLVCKLHLQLVKHCFLTLICTSTGSDASPTAEAEQLHGRSRGSCSSQWDTCPSQIQAASDLGPRTGRICLLRCLQLERPLTRSPAPEVLDHPYS